ncbi:hypothetical protein ED312_07330 [Sinomicrobium pectinilyticum]|uniref:Uncharacterized protein n=2 Tax=Sinomicrobium pectinilyticum TaxID=1084421 RepID=A0A3N0EPD1_SINP1|nr:hypothetical protein ED312_07330 [Sinomicrobium pectinilyticum]
MLSLLAFNEIYAQDSLLKEVEYTIIAEGTDSPVPNLQIVCFNKFFNKDYLPADFREKYKLNEKGLYKKKMLIEIFRTDEDKNGFDDIELVGIKENKESMVVEYNLVNSDNENDDKALAPFLIVQVPKSQKQIRFIVNGKESEGRSTKLYVD